MYYLPLLLGVRGGLLGTAGRRIWVLFLCWLKDVLGRIVVQHGTQTADQDLELIEDLSSFYTH